MTLFFDTSALVKYFHREHGSDKVEELIDSVENTVWLSELSRIEAMSAFHRRFRMGEIDAEALAEAVSGFDEELARFRVQPLNTLIAKEAEMLIRKHGHNYSLRTLDAIQMAVFSLLQEQDWHFVLADDALDRVLTDCGFLTIKV